MKPKQYLKYVKLTINECGAMQLHWSISDPVQYIALISPNFLQVRVRKYNSDMRMAKSSPKYPVNWMKCLTSHYHIMYSNIHFVIPFSQSDMVHVASSRV